MNQYLIPANSKRSMLILGLFTPVDLIIVAIGGLITLALLFAVNAETIQDIGIILTPLLISAAMVSPVPNHRNVWNLTANIYNFFSKRRTYYWKGWCMTHVEEETTNEK
ncbi:hypothetical protein [Lactobacillus intestinalis]|jgi:hypothetical protein|uniref:hypothetical protein n=1 Tax=Lactobacillus intestinalis TaxID=151781 RepID=UPI00272DB79E|nr:hypothetical protein [Lactobacillus intestinalis]